MSFVRQNSCIKRVRPVFLTDSIVVTVPVINRNFNLCNSVFIRCSSCQRNDFTLRRFNQRRCHSSYRFFKRNTEFSHKLRTFYSVYINAVNSYRMFVISHRFKRNVNAKTISLPRNFKILSVINFIKNRTCTVIIKHNTRNHKVLRNDFILCRQLNCRNRQIRLTVNNKLPRIPGSHIAGNIFKIKSHRFADRHFRSSDKSRNHR